MISIAGKIANKSIISRVLLISLVTAAHFVTCCVSESVPGDLKSEIETKFELSELDKEFRLDNTSHEGDILRCYWIYWITHPSNASQGELVEFTMFAVCSVLYYNPILHLRWVFGNHTVSGEFIWYWEEGAVHLMAILEFYYTFTIRFPTYGTWTIQINNCNMSILIY
jgi:hypothetical protein